MMKLHLYKDAPPNSYFNIQHSKKFVINLDSNESESIEDNQINEDNPIIKDSPIIKESPCVD